MLTMQSKLIFNPMPIKESARPRSSAHRTRSIVLRGADGTRLSGWLMLPPAPGPHPAVLYFGGRSEEISWVVRDAARMFPRMAVLAMNYRGYGGSAGFPGEKQMVEDACLLFDWMAARHPVDASRIALVGRSLGSGVAMQVAVQRQAAALVLLTPYDSLLAIAKRRFPSLPVSLLLRHRFESIKYAPQIMSPTLVLRAACNEVVPSAHTDLLIARLGNPAYDQTVPGSDQCTLPYLQATQQRIAHFLSNMFYRGALEKPATPITAKEPRAASCMQAESAA